MHEMRNGYIILVGRYVGKRPLERPRQRWEDNVRMDEGNRMGMCGLDASGSG
jgi:hypothetical protein